MNIQEYIAKRIKQLRKEQNFSQEKLSEIAGLGNKTVQNIEANKYDFRIMTIAKIMVALDVSVEEFFSIPFSKSNQELVNELIGLIDETVDDKQEIILKALIEIIKNVN
ncbi:helix-turn-helix transcriptional regulator [Tuanshanicoccus lijuaniae]|uniref:helix-turn-helix domain-containing protein n=1 Tax=Aerococcaceae bacterium zg-1292 TaxID=2774330 RepID=UPI001935E3EC|nr:helix-turn-helix transcriptional regulator [Aerococcaceae bacterium zg-1292]QQA36550.1 helix-turn-helix transcriptional regulator [Aerococcaceae bacterium zg-1292]QQA36552.1 helix-turn-helix transcriptional regulator [Aerococcaceae bacterium zg-1292]